MNAISIRQARAREDLVRAAVTLNGAVVELCTYPEVREETLNFVEPQAVLMLGLSRLLSGSEGRIAGDPRRPFLRFGALALRPAGIPLEIHVGPGAFDTIRIRFEPARIAPALEGAKFDDALLAACLDLRSHPIEEAMLRLASELDHCESDAIAMVEALVTLILLDLARYLQSAAARGRRRSGGLSARALRRALAMIDADGPPPQIDAIADHCGLSRHHFIRCFTQSTGVGPGAAIRRRLIERAKTLLVEGDHPIDEIAKILGYAGAPSFATAFRRETGRSPGVWRALMR
ncbi:AraC family transcriptional regulator [Sphingobium sp. OAS761]|uniref:helix-turn-helix domain-containing protein n=1 Tax=Sphingobium sp. OAS761 TaxID=2817901 RepID=UPI00209F52A4|nr:AraC family transcriptional regulator [Sphingobium sp. OAS761]MCP1470275.1 AraC family transcriptional regulator [Sphingobium sp. OAS761]